MFGVDDLPVYGTVLDPRTASQPTGFVAEILAVAVRFA
jgi:hypothetical protein